jgi:hypothetical protein
MIDQGGIVQSNHNEGVRMSGGRIEAGAFAVGRGATAKNVTGHDVPGQEQIARRLEELLSQLEANSARLDNPDEVREATQVVVDELGKERPNKMTVTGVLTSIAAAVTSVSGLAAATDALLESVGQFL